MIKWLKRLFGRRKLTIKSNYDNRVLWGFYNDAAQRLGRKVKSGTLHVHVEPGTERSADPHWMGKRSPHWSGIATGFYSPKYGVILYTTNGRIRPATGVHEFAHFILDKHGVAFPDHHAIMRQHGIP
jgi:hypothetical protein